MRHGKTVLTPWILAVALMTCALAVTHQATAQARLQVSIQPVKKRLRAHDKQRVQAQVRWTGPAAKLSYEWSALRGTLPPSTVTTNKTLELDASELTPGEEYVLELRVSAVYTLPPESGGQRDQRDRTPDEKVTDQVAAQASVSFSVNAAPAGGNCKAAIDWQPNSRAVISADASGWHDDDGDALQYRYYLVKGGSRRLLQNWTSATSKVLTTRAVAGDELALMCEVRDALGDISSASSQPTRRP